MEDLDVSEKRIGTTETLLGLIAVACEKAQERTNNVFAGFTYGELFNGIHKLQLDPKFEKELKYLDFELVGPDSWYSRSLDDFLFMTGVPWGGVGFHQTVIEYGMHILTVEPSAAKKRIRWLREKYGEESVSRIEEMADALIKVMPRYS